MLLLIDALERHDPTALDDCETPVLINLYTLLSDVERNAGDLRKDVRGLLLDRLHHDQAVHGQYGSVQQATRRNRSLNDEDDELVAARRTISVIKSNLETELFDGQRYEFEVFVESVDSARRRDDDLQPIFQEGVELYSTGTLQQIKQDIFGGSR